MSYLPVFVKQLDGTTYAGLNCTAASAAMAADFHSLGHIRLSASQVRTWTGDTSGGTNLAQIDYALRTHVNIDLDTRYRLAWTEFTRRINAGEGAILQGWYAPIRATRFRGSDTFGGNHAIFVPPGWGAMDPLCDGRRTGIYKYHGEAYPQSLLREFAGRLNVGGSSYVSLGLGLVYAAFTRDNVAAAPRYEVSIRPTPPATSKAFFTYTLTNGVITKRTTNYTGGFSAACSASRLWRWPAQDRSEALVQITSGSRAGKYVQSKYQREA